jgi:hypothetical protein
MTRAEIGAYKVSESLVFGGQVHKSLDVDGSISKTVMEYRGGSPYTVD